MAGKGNVKESHCRGGHLEVWETDAAIVTLFVSVRHVNFEDEIFIRWEKLQHMNKATCRLLSWK